MARVLRLGLSLLAVLAIPAMAELQVTIPRKPVGSAPPLPPGKPHPPPDYMKDNINNYFGTAPDKGYLTGPVLEPLNQHELAGIHGGPPDLGDLEARADGDGYWLSTAGSSGQMPFAPSKYQFFRNVMDFGATGDGVTDDTAAINRAAATFGAQALSRLRCGASCGSTTTLGAVVYFPPGTYLISTPIIQYYYTQFVGNPETMPTIKGTHNFTGIALFDTDFYIPGGDGAEWYINQSNFYRQIRNFNFDMTGMNWTNMDGGQQYVPTGIHWQVGQATSITNCKFNMSLSQGSQRATGVGIFMENGSGGLVSDLVFYGGNIGFTAGSQQFTAKNLQFTSCLTAIYSIFNWGFTWKNIYVYSCFIALDCTSYSGVTNQGTGSITVLDSYFNYVPYAITIADLGNEQPNIVLDNLLVENSASVVLISGGQTILNGSSSPLYFNSWASGYQYLPDGSGGKMTGFINLVPNKPATLLDDSGAYFAQSKPQYYGQTPIIATDHGILNDATGDQTAAINNLLAANVGSLIFFPGGIYLVEGTVKVPVGSIITGSGWSQIMATGSYFQDVNNPQVMVQVGNIGDSGVIQITDMLFTVQGPTAGAILVEWNVHESSQGSAAMWDSHFRVGGATGTSLQLANCPDMASSVNKSCMAASMLMHVTSEASGYFENVWAWVADHDLDNKLNSQAYESPSGIPLNVKTDISIYAGRGILIESQGPTWLYGTSAEHSQLYQYQLLNASNIFLGVMQTETPYYQPNPNALSPFIPGQFPSDPTFKNCANDLCRGSWALRVLNSSDVYIYGAGFYSFFENNELGCAPNEDCQLALIETNFANQLWIYNIFTKGNVQIVSPDGGLAPLLFNATTTDGYTSEIAAWLALAQGGSDIGSPPGGGSGYVTIDPDVWSPPATTPATVMCFPPCTYVFPPLTLSEPTTFSFPPLTTTLTVGRYSTTTGLDFGQTETDTYYSTSIETTVISISAITTNVISWFDVTITARSAVIYPIPSVTAPPFNITDPTKVGGTTFPPNTRTFYPPPWPGSTVPSYLTKPTPSGVSGTEPSQTTGPTSVHHTRGPPSPTCTHVLGCGHHCPIFHICLPCWLFCDGPPGDIDTNGPDPNEPGGKPPIGGPPPPDECETKTFTSCDTLCRPATPTKSCTTTCSDVIGCSSTSGTSSCVPLSSYDWTPNDPGGPLPTMGAGGFGNMFGFTYTTGSVATTGSGRPKTITKTITYTTSIYTTIGAMNIAANIFTVAIRGGDVVKSDYLLNYEPASLTADVCTPGYSSVAGIASPRPTTWSAIPQQVSFYPAITSFSKSYSNCVYTNTETPKTNLGGSLSCAGTVWPCRYFSYSLIKCGNSENQSIQELIRCPVFGTATSVVTSTTVVTVAR